MKVVSGAHGLVWVRPDDERLKVGDTPYVKAPADDDRGPTGGRRRARRSPACFIAGAVVSRSRTWSRRASATTPTYKLWTFNTSQDQPYAKASGTAATALTLAQLLALESQHKLDLNDVAIGDKVARFSCRARPSTGIMTGLGLASPYLVRLEFRGYGLISRYRDVSVDKTTPSLPQTSAGANWVPASGTTITGVCLQREGWRRAA